MNRVIPDSKLNEYKEAGWTVDNEAIKATVHPKKVKVETPVVESQPTVAMLDAVIEEQANDSKGE
jgi:hypothetical protein